MKRLLRITFWSILLLLTRLSYAQQSANVVDFQVTYDQTTMRYTAYVVPRYNVPNTTAPINNTLSSEYGGTAQFTLKVPPNFIITSIQDVNGTWDKNPPKLGPGNPGQTWPNTLDPTVNYYVIGKSPNETPYGPFSNGVPVPLFTFQGNGCFGPISPLEAGNPFIALADQQASLNVANSFFSRSGQPAGGNQNALEQFRTVTGYPAVCAILIATPDSKTTAFNTATTISILANDTSNSQPVSTTTVTTPAVSQPPNGTAVVNGNGTVTYTPRTGFAGTDVFSYTICDAIDPNKCSNTTVSVLVQSVPPIANPDSQTTAFGTPTTVVVLANDFDKNGNPASLTNVSAPVTGQPANGTAVVNANGTITYTPNPGFTGTDSFTYAIGDNVDLTKTSSTTVTITVLSAPPVANPDSQTTSFGQSTTICVLANDRDKNNAQATLSNVTLPAASQPANGTVTVNATTGCIVYTPKPGFTGTDLFSYTICDIADLTKCSSATVSIGVQSAPPVANPDTQPTAFNTPTTVVVLANDFDKNGNPASLTNVSAPVITTAFTNGSATINATTGVLSYTPNTGFTGTDVAIYRIGDIPDGTKTSSTTVTITVQSAPPVATPDSQTTSFGQSTTICVLANDKDKNNTQATLSNVTLPAASQPTNGTVTVNATTGCLVYTPKPGFTGTDVFSYTICDIADLTKCSSASVSVGVQSAPPVANPDTQPTAFNTPTTVVVLANDFDKNGNPASLTNVSAPVITTAFTNGSATINATTGVLSYTPNAGFTGTDVAIYRIADLVDLTKTSSTTVTILVDSKAPVANPDSQTTSFGQSTTICVLANDKDKTGNQATLTNVSVPVVGQPANGTVTVNATTGCLVYTPKPGFTGTDLFSYTICDKVDPTKCSTANVSVGVQSAPPVANPDSRTTAFGTPISVTVLANDLDKNNNPASLTNVSAPSITNAFANGTASVNLTTGVLSYTPNAGFTGTDVAIYQIADSVDPSKTSSTTVTITVLSAPPVANPDSQTTSFGQSTTICVLANDKDKNNTQATLTNVSVPVVGQPANGTVTVNATTGCLVYTPKPGFTGTDLFSYTICDKADLTKCSSASVSVGVQSAPPMATPDSQTTSFGQSTTICVLANDKDKNNTQATLSNVTLPAASQPANGTVTVNATTGCLVYTPKPGFTGTDVFSYTICDIADLTKCSSATVSVGVQSAPPVANPDTQPTAFNTPTTVVVLANDFDKNGNPASLTNVSAPVITTAFTNGSATINATTGVLSYTPNAGFTGTDVAIYRIADLVDLTKTSSTTVTILVDSKAPVANPDSQTTSFGQSTTICVLANDKDKTGDQATLANVTLPTVGQPTNGTVTVNATTGCLVYTPRPGFTGTDVFSYTICDKADLTKCSSATVSVGVQSAPPVATPDSQTTSFGQSTTICVLANDRDKNNTQATLSNVTLPTASQPANGTITVNATTGCIIYTPRPGFTGTDVFSYTICDIADLTKCSSATVSVGVQSAAPVANPDSQTTAFGTPVSVTVLANDLDKNSNPASLTNVSAPVITTAFTNGSATINVTTGVLSYTPNAGFTGTDVAIYRIGDIPDGTKTSSTTVTITVQSAPPVATPDSQTTSFGQSTTICVLANDKDKNNTQATLSNVTLPAASQPANGIVTVNATTGCIVYTPKPGFTGTDVFSYTICDIADLTKCSSATVSVGVQSAPPVANPDTQPTAFNTPTTVVVLANDFDKNGNLASVTNVSAPVITTAFTNGSATVNPTTGVLSYTPNAGFTGTDVAIYRISDLVDPTKTSSTTVTILVDSKAPVANPDSQTTSFGQSTTICVLANDKDKAGAQATLANVTLPTATQPANGTVTVNATTGCLVYTPKPGFTGTDVFSYTICDKADPTKCSSANISVGVQSAPPVANPDSQTTAFGTPTTVIILANDKDKNGNPASLTTVTVPTIINAFANGTASVNLITGVLSYTPNAGFTGTDVATYQIGDIVDPTKTSSTTVTILVQSAAPVATPDSQTTSFGQSTTICVLANDKDKTGAQATLANVTLPTVGQPANGTVTVNATTGCLVYTPKPGFTGTDVFSYTICDKADPTKCSSASVSVGVQSPILPPLVTPDIANTNINTPVSGNVVTNDSDPQGGLLTVGIQTPPTVGTVTLTSTGPYTYTPPTGFTGVASFCYSATNTAGLSASTCVTINVLPTPISGNNPPVANADATQTTVGVPVVITVLANDTDPDSATSGNGQLNTPTLLAQPTTGTAVVNGNGSVTYTPPANFTGVVTFPYQVCDKATSPLCATALVTVNVLPTPPVGTTLPPVAVDDALLTRVNTPATGNVATNDYDPQGLPLTFTSGQPGSGTVTMSSTGSYTYTPPTGFVGPTSFTYTVCNTGSKCDVATVSVLVQPNPVNNSISLLPKVYLQGALFGVLLPDLLMRDDLRQKGLIPTSDPYPALSMTGTTFVGSIPTGVLSTTGANAIVDWVFVELRSPASNTLIVDSRAALVQRDGDIVDVDGVSPLSFSTATSGNYYVAIRHRNHLGVMTQTAIPLSSTTTIVDFRSPATPTFSFSNASPSIPINQPQVVVVQGVAMWAGNALRDGAVIYQGQDNDVNAIFLQINNAPGNVFGSPYFKHKGYYLGDIDLNGETIYQGTGNDLDFIYQNITKNHSGNTLLQNFFIIKEQLP